MNELDKLVANLAPSKQAEVRFFVQQLLESLEEGVEKMKSTNIEPHSHGGWSDGSYCMECETVRDNERTNDTLDEVKALIQSKKESLMGL